MILVIVGIWVLVAFLIDPRGEFPLNDDWAYAGPVRALLAGRGIKLSGWGQSNIIAQILWGSLFCLPFGFSFTALRISTLTLGVIGALALYGLLRESDADRETALFGALLLAFNPLYLVLSYSFMSDVPFTAVSVLSFYFLVRGMKRNSGLAVVAGLLLACVALLIRQLGLAIFIGCSLMYLARSGSRLRKVLLASAPLALGGVVQIIWRQWMEYRHILPAEYSLSAVRVLSLPSYVLRQNAEPFAAGLITISVYLGLFLFPLFLFVGRRSLGEFCRSRILIASTLLFAVFASYELSYRRMPLLPNVLYDLGLGPVTLRDTSILRLPAWVTAGRSFWFVVTYLGFVGAVALIHGTLVAIAKTLNFMPLPTRKREALIMLLASGFAYLVPVAILALFAGYCFDRYLLFLLPLGIAIVTLLVSEAGPGKAGSVILPFAVGSLVLYAALSVAGTHDYLSWNRARWQALNDLLTEQRVPACKIDGGFEFNGWYFYDPNYRATPEKSWWWVAGDDFMVTSRRVPGFTELKRYPFRRWLPPAVSNILALRRTTPSVLPSNPRCRSST